MAGEQDDGALYDVLRYHDQVVLIGCDVAPQKRVLCAVAYLGFMCPPRVPLYSGDKLVATMEVPQQFAQKPMPFFLTSKLDSVEFPLSSIILHAP